MRFFLCTFNVITALFTGYNHIVMVTPAYEVNQASAWYNKVNQDSEVVQVVYGNNY